MSAIWILIGLVVVVGLWIVGVYNGLVKSGVRVDEAWSDITVQLKRRYDLIPNLVKTVKGYAKHEKEVLENVTKMRNMAVNATGSPEQQAQVENQFTGALKSLFAVAENYPDLKANENFLELQRELTDTENKIQAARRFYNGAVRDLNTKIKVFPTNIFAGMLGFTEREFFEVEDRETVEQPVDVDFNDEN
jgi:LemA protein